GAFSELLAKYDKKSQKLQTMSLAGTLPINENWTKKEIEEQQPVTDYIRNILSEFVSEQDIIQSETYDHFSGNIKHLRTDFEINLDQKHLDSVISALHPTPAVCGIPKDFCKENIANFENYNREFYAGYSRIETENTIYCFVNLRCAKLYKNKAFIFVGGGITAESQPEKEWQETELKAEAIQKNLAI
ncbi:MAG: chorismate-binding protein, partial [Cruoricaptor ignavus]|nr:chorismate-binding protein [Cruoricaptor ignavus]